MLEKKKFKLAPANIIFGPFQQKIGQNHNQICPNHNSPSTKKLAQITTIKINK
jgi:hypothetical protein